MDNVQIQIMAATIFSSSLILMSVGLVLISSCWTTLKEILAKLPPKQRRIIFNLRNIKSRRSRYKEELKGSLYSTIFFLGLMIIGNVASIFCVARTMLGIHGSIYELQDFNFARYSLLASVILLFFALFSLGYYRFSEFIGMKQGKLEIIKELSLPRRTISKKRGRD